MAGEGLSFDIDAPDIKSVLNGLKDIDPKLATNLRRELRQSGEDIIQAQRQVLAGRPPRIGGASRKLVWIRPKGRTPYRAFRTTYQPGDVREGGVSDLRDKIANGLRTRIVTGKRRQGVEVKTTGPRNEGYNMARIWQKKNFRHPVFNSGHWAAQFGQDYFFAPITDELRTRMRDRIEDAVTNALNAAAH